VSGIRILNHFPFRAYLHPPASAYSRAHALHCPLETADSNSPPNTTDSAFPTETADSTASTETADSTTSTETADSTDLQ